MRPLSEHTVLVTGATSGHGRSLATELAARGATVLVHGRDDTSGRRAIADIAARRRLRELSDRLCGLVGAGGRPEEH